LDDPRGNLMLTYLAIADKYRPRWLVWENVPGVLSSNGGKDFGVFLGALGELGYGFAYRILDAQYFGVAQRRRRVFVVGYLGDWRAAAAVLFERHSLQGHPAPSREKGQAIAPSVTTGAPFSRTGNDRVECEAMVVSKCLTARGADGQNQDPETATFLPIAFDLAQITSVANRSRAEPGLPSSTITKGSDMHVAQPTIIHGTQDPCVSDIAFAQGRNNGGENVLVQAVGTDLYNGAITGDVAVPMTNRADGTGTGPTVMQSMAVCLGGQHPNAGIGIEQSPTLTEAMGAGGGHVPITNAMAVRRLTPVECERLQGFSDNYTDIRSKGKPTPDGPRYKALGNSMAVPVMAWIGQRIEQVEAICQHKK
jgi:DNA (cytosine-5)-methyltransferase 1